MGSRQHQCIRWRSQQRHHLRRICRRRQRAFSSRHARSRNPVPVIIGTTRDEMDLFKILDPWAATETTEPPDVWARVNTDTAMWLHALAIAEARSAHGPTWIYRFDWEAASSDMGAPHGVDIPFPFTTIDVDGWDTFVEDSEQAMSLASVIQQSWADFANDGVPTLGDTEWPAFGTENRTTAIFGRKITVESDPNGQVRQAWHA